MLHSKKENMKVMLIYPPISAEDTYADFSFAAPILPPLGLAYLAAFLLKEGVDVRIVDCVAEKLNYNRLLVKIKEYKPQVVGFNANTISYPKVQKALPMIKKLNPQIITVIGGAHPSAMPKQVLEENSDLDVVVFGEGEFTLLEIVKNLENNKYLENIAGTVVRKKNKIIVNKPRQLIADLDNLPFPARNLLQDLKAYSHTPLRGTGFIVSMMTSRGCPFNCFYCDQAVFNRKWRANSADYVINEIKMLKEKYKADAISFEDDNFALSKDRTIEICQKMMDDNLNIKWSCCIRIDKIDEEILTWMKKAGCRSIYVGIETGNTNMLKSINKNLTLAQIRSALKIAKQVGIENVYGSFILGLPGDTKKTINQTIEFACSLPLTGVSFNIFTPYPNTQLRLIAPKFGVIKEGWENYSDHANFVPYVPNGITESELLAFQKKAYRKFFFRPSYIFKHLHYMFNFRFMKDAILALFIFFKLKKSNPKEYFDSKANSYNLERSSGFLGKIVDKEREAVMDALDLKKGESVLDAGCGAGYYSMEIKKKKGDPYGIDISPIMIKHLKANGIQGHVENLDNFDLERKFDKVLCSGSLEFTKNPKNVLKLMAKHLKKEGKFVLIYPRFSIPGLLYKFYHFLHRFNITTFSSKEMKIMLKKAGFKDIKDKKVDFLCSIVIATRNP